MSDTPETPASPDPSTSDHAPVGGRTELVAWGAATHVGHVRQGNEDAFVADGMVYAVADGMGGHNAGEVASAIAASTLGERLKAGVPSVNLLEAAVVEANAAIFQAAHGNSSQRGMGTTLTGLVVLNPADGPMRVGVANVGDSRTYAVRGGQLHRVSLDHSYVQELVSTGHITEQEARHHPRRNIVTRALGIEPSVRVDTWVLPMVKGDRYVMCSDGLVDEIDDDAIASILNSNADPATAAQALVDAANAHGGHDNTTVLVVDVLVGDDPETSGPVPMVDHGEAPDRLIDADAGSDVVVEAVAEVVSRTMVQVSTTPDIQPRSLGAEPPARRGMGVLLFGIALGLIVMLTAVLVLVVRHNADEPAPTTSTSTSTTSSTTSTSTTSTVASSTSGP